MKLNFYIFLFINFCLFFTKVNSTPIEDLNNLRNSLNLLSQFQIEPQLNPEDLLMNKIEFGTLPEIEAILKAKNISNINFIDKKEKMTPLILASALGKPEIVELLLQFKADPNITLIGSNARALDFAQALYKKYFNNILLANRFFRVIELLEKASQPNTLEDILMEKIKYGALSEIEGIIKDNFNVNFINKKLLLTPLMYAVIMLKPEVVELLLKYKADPNIQDPRSNATALDFARYLKNDRIIKMLQKVTKKTIKKFDLDADVSKALFKQIKTEANAYEILGLDENADATAVKKAFRKLALTWHPDKGGNAEVFKTLSIAYEQLKKDLSFS